MVKQDKYRSAYLVSFVLSAFIGIFFEYLQNALTETRTADIYDIIANTTGALIALFAYELLMKNRKLEKIIF